MAWMKQAIRLTRLPGKFDEYGNDITDLSDDAASAVTEASRQIVEAYDNMQQGIADAIENSISFLMNSAVVQRSHRNRLRPIWTVR